MAETSKSPQSVTANLKLRKFILDCEFDTELFASHFMEEIFFRPTAKLQREFISQMDDPKVTKLLVEAPRGLGKTAWLNAFIIKQICLRKVKSIIYVSKTLGHAQTQTENIKAQLLTNPDIKKVFGSLRPQKIEGIDPVFAKTSFVLSDPQTKVPICYIFPRGMRQQVRGTLIFQAGKLIRPDLIALDDTLDDKNVMNEDIRKEDKIWIEDTLLNVRDVYDAEDSYKVVWVDTFRHPDASTEHFIDHPDWVGLRLGVCDKDLNSLIPELWSTEKIKSDVDKRRKAGTLAGWYREFMNLPTPLEDATFSEKMFQDYDERELRRKFGDRMDGFIIVDPARTATPQSCPTGMVAVGIDLTGHAYYVRECIHERMHINKQPEVGFALAKRYGIRVIAVEVTGGDDLIRYLWTNYASQHRIHCEFIWLKATRIQGDYGTGREAPKRARVGQLSPYYRAGQMYHNKATSSCLEQILLSYPFPKEWDVADALGHMPQVLELGSRYFQPEAKVREEEDAEFLEFFNGENSIPVKIPDVMISDEVFSVNTEWAFD